MSTYSQIYIQIIFAVKGSNSLIHLKWEEKVFKYITGIVRNKEQKILAINGMPDHIHFLVGMKPSCCLSDLVREIKKSSNSFINENKLTDALEMLEWSLRLQPKQEILEPICVVVRHKLNEQLLAS